MNSIICGGGGFIGFNLAKKILEKGNRVFILDNFSNSKKETINALKDHNNIEIFDCELSNYFEIENLFNSFQEEISSDTEIWHLAANSDIVSGVNQVDIDYRDTFMTTYNLLKISKKFKIRSFFFASSSAVYGNHGDKLVNENTGPLIPISNYGAMKLASEAICFASYESFLKKLIIFRFPNVVGSPATHGVIMDLITKLQTSPNLLKVLGNGTQAKSYLHVDDLVQIEKKKSDDSIDSNKYHIYPIKEISSPKQEKMDTHKKETSILFTPFLGFRADRATFIPSFRFPISLSFGILQF